MLLEKHLGEAGIAPGARWRAWRGGSGERGRAGNPLLLGKSWEQVPWDLAMLESDFRARIHPAPFGAGSSRPERVSLEKRVGCTLGWPEKRDKLSIAFPRDGSEPALRLSQGRGEENT